MSKGIIPAEEQADDLVDVDGGDSNGDVDLNVSKSEY